MILHDHLLCFRFGGDTAEAGALVPIRGATRPVSVLVPASPATVFHLLADIESLPAWLPEFCERLGLASGRWVALTPLGELVLELQADAERRTVELRGGEDDRRLERIAWLEVREASGGRTTVTAAFPPLRRLPDGDQRRRRLFAHGLNRLPERFRIAGDTGPASGADAATAARPRWTGFSANLFERLLQPRRAPRSVSRNG